MGLDDASAEATPDVQIISFVAPTQRIGRTSTIANVAFVLAGAGRRVLIADWDVETPRLHSFLAPFLIDPEPDLADDGVLSALGRSGRIASIRRYGLPKSSGETGEIDVVEFAARDVEPLAGDGSAVALRQALRSSQYQHVLLDHPAGASEDAYRQLALLSDATAVCFMARAPAAIHEAAAIVRLMRRAAPMGLDLFAVVTRFEPGRGAWAQEKRNLIRRAFADAGGGDGAEIAFVEIPYRSFDAHDEVLAVLIDDPSDPAGQAGAYEDLSTMLTGGTVDLLPPVAAKIRTRYRRGLGLDEGGPSERIVIVAEAENRPWVDWITHQLGQGGAAVRRTDSLDTWRTVDASASAVIVIVSPVTDAMLKRYAHTDDHEGQVPEVVRVRVTANPAATGQVIELFGRSEERARIALLGPFLMIALSRLDTESDSGPRFPASDGSAPRSRHIDLPPRNPAFVGRSAALESLRDALIDPSRNGRVSLTGHSGMGKSETALEYAHRFAYDYDVVWWVPAQSRSAARLALARLAMEVDAQVRVGHAADAALAARAALENGRTWRRWLLIFDNVEDPSVVTELAPAPGTGHVVVTARPPVRPLTGSESQSIVEMNDDESARLLTVWATNLQASDARSVVQAVNHVPLAVRLAGSWLMEEIAALREEGVPVQVASRGAADELVARIGEAAHRTSAGGDLPASQLVLNRVVGLLTDSMSRNPFGALAFRLAEMCVFLFGDNIALRLLRAAPMIECFLDEAGAAGQRIAADPIEIDRIIWTAVRYGLVEVDWGAAGALRMHRAVQEAVGGQMEQSHRDKLNRTVLAGLAGFAPTEAEAEGPDWRARLAELHKHFATSGATTAAERSVRRWVVTQIRYAIREGDADTWRSTLETASAVRDRWAADLGSTPDLRLRLDGLLADLYRALDQPELSHDIDERTQREQRMLLGTDHLRSLISGRGKAGDLRGLGEFYEARVEDHATHEGMAAALGEDHPNSLMAAHNLALSSFLMGDVRAAAGLERDVLSRRIRLFGTDDPLTWWSASSLGVYLREIGEYGAATKILRQAWDWVNNNLPVRQIDEMRIQRALAVIKRRTGDPTAAMEDNATILERCRVLFGNKHQETWRSEMAIAADRHALGDSAAAVELAQRCRIRYEQRLPRDHPFIGACLVNLAAFYRRAGRSADAADTVRAAGEVLRRRLDDGHPWVLAADINHAVNLAAAGAFAEADRVEAATLAECRDSLGPTHPYTQIVESNNRLTAGALKGGVDGDGTRRDVEIDLPST